MTFDERFIEHRYYVIPEEAKEVLHSRRSESGSWPEEDAKRAKCCCKEGSGGFDAKWRMEGGFWHQMKDARRFWLTACLPMGTPCNFFFWVVPKIAVTRSKWVIDAQKFRNLNTEDSIHLFFQLVSNFSGILDRGNTMKYIVVSIFTIFTTYTRWEKFWVSKRKQNILSESPYDKWKQTGIQFNKTSVCIWYKLM